VDEITPGCETGEGCLLPQLSEIGHHVLWIRGMMEALKDVVNGETVLKMYSVTRDELELLAEVEVMSRSMGKTDQ
jgi:hypothetical protein